MSVDEGRGIANYEVSVMKSTNILLQSANLGSPSTRDVATNKSTRPQESDDRPDFENAIKDGAKPEAAHQNDTSTATEVPSLTFSVQNIPPKPTAVTIAAQTSPTLPANTNGSDPLSVEIGTLTMDGQVMNGQVMNGQVADTTSGSARTANAPQPTEPLLRPALRSDPAATLPPQTMAPEVAPHSVAHPPETARSSLHKVSGLETGTADNLGEGEQITTHFADPKLTKAEGEFAARTGPARTEIQAMVPPHPSEAKPVPVPQTPTAANQGLFTSDRDETEASVSPQNEGTANAATRPIDVSQSAVQKANAAPSVIQIASPIAEFMSTERPLASPVIETTQSAPPRDALPRAPITTSIIVQIREAVATAPMAHRFEVTLDPPELGRVAMELEFREQGVTMVVRAERADALDLMRRHSVDLVRDMRALGLEFDDLSFESGANGRDSRQDQDEKFIRAANIAPESNPDDGDAPTSPEVWRGARHALQNARDGGLDLRV